MRQSAGSSHLPPRFVRHTSNRRALTREGPGGEDALGPPGHKPLRMVATTTNRKAATPRPGPRAHAPALTPAQEERAARTRERARQKATKASARAAARRRGERRRELAREHARARADVERLAAEYLALDDHGSEEAVRLQARVLSARARAARLERQLAA